MTVTLARKLADLGASPEVIELAVEAVTLASRNVTRDSHAPSRSVTRDKVKEQNRLRQKRRRETIAAQRKLAEAQANDGAAASVTVTQSVTRDERDNGPIAPTSFLTSFDKDSANEGKKKVKKEAVSLRARGTRMEPGAPLTEEFRQVAIALGAPPAVIPEMWAEHVDYWVGVPGERGVKTVPNGWLATWRNDVRRKLKMGTYNGAKSQHDRTSQTPRSGATGQDAILAGLGRLADRVRARGESERREREASTDDGAAQGDDARLL